MVIGAPACAMNWALFTCVGRNVPKQAYGSCVSGGGPPHTGKVPNVSVVRAPSSRASAKYACASPPVLVIVIGTLTAPAATDSLVCGFCGRPVAFTCAALKLICAVNGRLVSLPEANRFCSRMKRQGAGVG